MNDYYEWKYALWIIVIIMIVEVVVMIIVIVIIIVINRVALEELDNIVELNKCKNLFFILLLLPVVCMYVCLLLTTYSYIYLEISSVRHYL